MQKHVLDQSAMHLTSLAFTTLDRANPEPRVARIDRLGEFLRTDTILYRATEPESLHAFQSEHWDPLRTWFQANLGAALPTSTELSSIHVGEGEAAVRKHLAGLSTWQLEAVDFAIQTSRSVVIGLALCMQHIDAPRAAWLANLETEYQV